MGFAQNDFFKDSIEKEQLIKIKLADIKKARDVIAKKYHPDKGGPEDDSRKFVEANNAYNKLSKMMETQSGIDTVQDYFTNNKIQAELKKAINNPETYQSQIVGIEKGLLSGSPKRDTSSPLALPAIGK